MKRNDLLKVLILTSILSFFSYLVSLGKENQQIITYINTTFLIGLFMLILSGSFLVISSGFFDVFTDGWKKIFFKQDPYTDPDHWSQTEQNENKKSNTSKYLIKIPLFSSILLLIQSTLILFFFYNH